MESSPYTVRDFRTRRVFHVPCEEHNGAHISETECYGDGTLRHEGYLPDVVVMQDPVDGAWIYDPARGRFHDSAYRAGPPFAEWPDDARAAWSVGVICP